MEIKQWKTKQLDEVATFSSGGTPSKQEPNYWEGDYPWVSAKDMKSFSINDAELKLTPQGLAVAKIAPKGSVLVLVRGMTLLKDLPVGYVERDVAFNQDIKALVSKTGVSGLFLAYSLIANKNRILNLVNVAGHGTGRLDTNLLKEFSIDFPPLPEQCKIAEILGAWDESIALLEKLITAKRKLKQGLMQQLLTGKKRFKEFEESETDKFLSKSSKEWRATTLGKCLSQKPKYGANASAIPYSPGAPRYIRITDITEYGYLTNNDVVSLLTENINEYVLKNNDFIIARSGNTVGKSFLYPEEKHGFAAYAGYLIKFVVDENSLVPSYLRYYAQSSQYWSCVKNSIRSGAQPNINAQEYSKFKILLPPTEEQERIASVLSAADAEISNLEKQLAAYKQQKRGLMQQLLTGKTRVRVN